MRLKNPNFKTKGQKELEKHQAKILQEIGKLAEADGEAVDFDVIRSAFTKAEQGELPDGVIHQVCLDNGIQVLSE